MNKIIHRSKENLKNKKGFTLIELIVVLVIIGILAAIVIPRLGGFSKTAQDKADLATARTIYSAVGAAIAADEHHQPLSDNNKAQVSAETNPVKKYLEGQDFKKQNTKGNIWTYSTSPIAIYLNDTQIYPEDKRE